MFNFQRSKPAALVTLGLVLAGLGFVYYLALAWAAGMFYPDSIRAHQSDYQTIELYSQRQAGGVYVVSDSPVCGRQAVDFGRGQRFGFGTDSLWVAWVRLAASDQDRYYCFKLTTGLFPFRRIHYLVVGPVDTTPPALSVRTVGVDLVVEIDWLSGVEMNLRRPNNQAVVQAARLQPGLDCGRPARPALTNQPPASRPLPEIDFSGPAPALASQPPHPDHFDSTPYLLTGPGSASGYDSPASLVLAVIPLADLAPESDYCFYVYDGRLARDSGSYIVYSPAG